MAEFAIEDLRLIHEYISKDSKVYADRQVDKIIKRVDQIINFPKLGRVVLSLILKLIRELIEGNYRIIYQVNYWNCSYPSFCKTIKVM